jgi:predicted alpha/beta-fold hydrolase
MPILDPSFYKSPPFFSNGHLQTIYPSLFRKVKGILYHRERIATIDDDFLDLDWSKTGSGKIAIVSHGLEGSSYRSYMLGMVKSLHKAGWDALAWNYRGCSGEPNDLHTVITHVISQNKYRKIALAGFSLGGNMTLKYLGERGETVDSRIDKAVVFSVPCDLAASSRKMAEPFNKIYMKRFLRMLHQKIKDKMEVLPGLIDDEGYDKIKNFRDFDDRYTAPIHGFANAEDYWAKCSCKQFIPYITIPTLLVSARNDPFLTKECYPVEEAGRIPHFYLEMPKSGGHVGFVEFNANGEYWSEQRVIAFLKEI